MSREARAALGVLGVFWAQFAWVRATNFGGFDEWVVLWLATHGILSSPYTNRPLNYLFTLPAALVPASFAGFYWLHAAYLALLGFCVYALARRLLPEQPRLALLSAVFSVAFIPNDMARLTSPQIVMNSGFDFGSAATTIVFVESWKRGRPALLLVAALLEVVMIRGYEGVAPLLVLGPLLLLAGELRREPSRARRWLAGWLGAGGLAGIFVAYPLLTHGGSATYQTDLLAFDPNPAHVLERLAGQFWLHLSPLVTTPPQLLLVPSVAASLLALAFALWAAPADSDAAPERRLLLRLAVLGLALAALAYLPFVLAQNIVGAGRTQMLAAPGIGLLLAAAIGLLAAPLFPRARLLVSAVLAGVVVAVGAARTQAMQRQWDVISYYEPQMSLLRSLTRSAPALAPHSLVLLLGGAKQFPSGFGFRHAVQYLYGDEVAGLSIGSLNALYPARFTPSGIAIEPWPEVRDAWGVPATLHRYDEVVAVRASPDGSLELLESWPSDLPRLPAGVAYDAGRRIVREAPPRAERAILAPR